MADATGETREPLRVTFDRRLKLEFHGARITSDAGLLAYRELDDALGLTAMAASTLAEGRRGRNIRHRLPGLLRQAVYGRLAGYEDVNDAPPAGLPVDKRPFEGHRRTQKATTRPCSIEAWRTMYEGRCRRVAQFDVRIPPSDS
jgi:hypothetical protein